jgi:O-antigen/teichoic acid export membrane protein
VSTVQRSALIYIGAATTSAAVPFLVLPLLTRWLGPAEFGRVGSYLALVNVAVVLVGLSTHGIVSVVHFKQGAHEVSRYVGAALRVLLWTALPLLALLWLIASWVERASTVPAEWAWTVAVVAATQFVIALAMAVFQAREQAWRYGALQIALAVGWGALSLWLIGVMGLGWEGRAIAQIAAAGLVALLACVWMRRAGVLRWGSGQDVLPDVLRFGLPLLPHSLAAAFMAGADRIVLAGTGGAEAAGQYFAAFQIAAVLSVTAAALNQAWVPWLYRRLAEPTAARSREVVSATYRLYAVFLSASALLAASATWLLPVVAGPQFAPAAVLLQWLAPAGALSGMYYLVTNYLFYASRTGVLSAITVSCSLLQILLMAWLAPRHGTQGVAMAVFAAALVYWLATWAAAQAVFPMPWRLRRVTL